jgi:hypothetical protein
MKGASRFSDHVSSTSESENSDNVEENEGIVSLGNIGTLDSLLALQEVHEKHPDTRDKARRHGDTIIEKLRRLQLGILKGSLSQERLLEIRSLIKDMPEQADPALKDILDQIALRARIEITKLHTQNR